MVWGQKVEERKTIQRVNLLSLGVILQIIAFYLFIYLFVCLGPHPQHMKVPRLGVESELQMPANTTATATWGLSRV